MVAAFPFVFDVNKLLKTFFTCDLISLKRYTGSFFCQKLFVTLFLIRDKKLGWTGFYSLSREFMRHGNESSTITILA